MVYDKSFIAEKLFDSADVMYVTDAADDSYTVVKDDGIFRSMFGEKGSYKKMMDLFMENTIDRIVADSEKYSVFFKEAGRFQGKFSRKARMRFGEEEVIFQMTNLPFDETRCIMLITYIDEKAYISDVRSNEKVNVIKSAYLFSMYCDLIGDTCSNMDMSEVDDNPVNSLDISYTQWRSTIVNMIWPEDQAAFNEFTDPENIKNTLEYHRSRSIDCQMMNLEGKYIWVKLIFNRVETGDDSEFRVVFVVEDIHESHMRLMEDLKKYESMAMKDSLTGLFNHGWTENSLRDSIVKCRAEGKPLSLIMFDIDHFKKVNDTFGHAVGDQVLKGIASLAKRNLMECSCMLGRWGGEEFLGICENVTGAQLAETAEKLRVTIENHEFETAGKITGSFGVTEVNDTETADEAFRRIDAALYRAKSEGRNRVITE